MAPKRQNPDDAEGSESRQPTKKQKPDAGLDEEQLPGGPVVAKETKKMLRLYDKCRDEREFGHAFTVEELMSMGIAETTEELLSYTQELIDRQLFCLLQQQNSTFMYRLRTKDVANSLLLMSVETRMIYGHVEGAGQQGTWKRWLTLRTNLHENTVGKSLKDLISKKLVKEIKSAKHPTRRIYMLTYLQPSAENAGGNFFSEGSLDGGLIENVSMVITGYLEMNAWAVQKDHPRKDREYHDLMKKLKREDEGKAAIEIDRPLFKTPIHMRNGEPLIPHAADFTDYPTIKAIQDEINTTGIMKNISLTEEDIQRLLQRLEVDGQVERIRGPDGKETSMYRSVRRSWNVRSGPESWYGTIDPDNNGFGPGNGLTQTPCGRCPVFKECRPGGIVSPQTCVYMEEWLQF
ncbi:RNA polymerase Rpc34 [Tothia fuscella]|uniref:DNA-directed RNA polymerase III subunit RPC6 n=1 Tax=Tothia fuscella TaxID=1048955 RepID=A0A9P4U3P3_9PEZI|nr:RNA polymerase Rpc34 [Tothia fuscella]